MDVRHTSAKALKLQQVHQQQKLNPQTLPLTPTKGQLLQGIVSARNGDAVYLLNIAGREIPAYSSVPLQVGQKLDLQVASVSPRIELKVIQDPMPRQIGTTIHLLDGRTPIHSQLAGLLDMLPADTPGGDKSLQALESFLRLTGSDELAANPDATRLQQVMDRLGMSMEQIPAGKQAKEATDNLKLALLELEGRSDTSKQQRVLVNQLLQTLDLFQMLHLRLNNEGLVFLPLPFPFLEKGYLLVEDREKGEQEQENQQEKPLSFSLHLQLEGLGNLRIELQQQEGKLDISFFTEDNEKMKFLRDQTDELSSRLTSVELNSVRFLSGSKEPNSELLQMMINDTTGVINTQA